MHAPPLQGVFPFSAPAAALSHRLAAPLQAYSLTLLAFLGQCGRALLLCQQKRVNSIRIFGRDDLADSIPHGPTTTNELEVPRSAGSKYMEVLAPAS